MDWEFIRNLAIVLIVVGGGGLVGVFIINRLDRRKKIPEIDVAIGKTYLVNGIRWRLTHYSRHGGGVMDYTEELNLKFERID